MNLTNLSQELNIERSENQVLAIVHGADGSIAPFYALASLLNCTLVAIAYEPSVVQECKTIEEFARVYWNQLATHYPDRSYLFSGYSYGGLVAYEMAALAQEQTGKSIPVFMLDPNLPLAMRDYVAHRLFELRVLATTVFPEKLVKRDDIAQWNEEQLFKVLTRCLKPERIESILSARKHCLSALSRYVFHERPDLHFDAFHASEKLGFDFIDEETKWITSGTAIGGNHFTMLSFGHIETIAKLINSKIEPAL